MHPINLVHASLAPGKRERQEASNCITYSLMKPMISQTRQLVLVDIGRRQKGSEMGNGSSPDIIRLGRRCSRLSNSTRALPLSRYHAAVLAAVPAAQRSSPFRGRLRLRQPAQLEAESNFREADNCTLPRCFPLTIITNYQTTTPAASPRSVLLFSDPVQPFCDHRPGPLEPRSPNKLTGASLP